MHFKGTAVILLVDFAPADDVSDDGDDVCGCDAIWPSGRKCPRASSERSKCPKSGMIRVIR